MENLAPKSNNRNGNNMVRKLHDTVGIEGRIPPQAPDLEQAVLGAIMLEQTALNAVIEILHPEVFYREANRKIFEAIHRLFAKSEPIDILTVTTELQKSNELELVGGAFYIAQLTNRIASAANIEYYAHIIIEKFIQRELIRISTGIMKEAYEDSSDVLDMLDHAEQSLFAVSETNLRRKSSDIRMIISEAVKQIEIAKNQEGHISGVPSGFTELDRVTAGWQKSDLVILAARPGMGKTAFILSMARNIAVDFKKPLAIFSLEMSSIQLVTRLIASETQIAADKLKKGSLEDFEWQLLNSKIGSLSEAPLFIDDTPALTIFELRAKCRRLKAQKDIQLILIDYLQLMSSRSDNPGGNREQEISNISRSLKSLAKELDVPIIALSQLSRAVETRGGNKRPLLSDLRESGAIEQDADMVLFIYRPEYYKIDKDEDGNPTQGMAELIIAKHRNGALKDVKLRFIDRFAKFTDYEDLPFNDDSNNFSGFNGGPQSYTVPSKMNSMPNDDNVPF